MLTSPHDTAFSRTDGPNSAPGTALAKLSTVHTSCCICLHFCSKERNDRARAGGDSLEGVVAPRRMSHGVGKRQGFLGVGGSTWATCRSTSLVCRALSYLPLRARQERQGAGGGVPGESGARHHIYVYPSHLILFDENVIHEVLSGRATALTIIRSRPPGGWRLTVDTGGDMGSELMAGAIERQGACPASSRTRCPLCTPKPLFYWI